MTGYLLMLFGLALAGVGIAFVVKPPRRLIWAIACFVGAAAIVTIGFWSESSIGDDGGTDADAGPTPTMSLMVGGSER